MDATARKILDQCQYLNIFMYYNDQCQYLNIFMYYNDQCQYLNIFMYYNTLEENILNTFEADVEIRLSTSMSSLNKQYVNLTNSIYNPSNCERKRIIIRNGDYPIIVWKLKQVVIMFLLDTT